MRRASCPAPTSLWEGWSPQTGRMTRGDGSPLLSMRRGRSASRRSGLRGILTVSADRVSCFVGSDQKRFPRFRPGSDPFERGCKSPTTGGEQRRFDGAAAMNQTTTRRKIVVLPGGEGWWEEWSPRPAADCVGMEGSSIAVDCATSCGEIRRVNAPAIMPHPLGPGRLRRVGAALTCKENYAIFLT